MTALIPLDWKKHRHLLAGRRAVFATPNGLVGGNWDVPAFVESWRNEVGIGPIEFRMRLGDADEVVTFEMFHRNECDAVFENENDAFMFKMKWL